jgi:hypothetical protein
VKGPKTGAPFAPIETPRPAMFHATSNHFTGKHSADTTAQ